MRNATPTIRPTLRLCAGLLLLSALVACGRANGGSASEVVVTNSGDIAPNRAVANKVEADGNDQPNNLVGVPAKAPNAK